MSSRAPRFYVIGGIAEKATEAASTASKKGIHIETSPCFEYYGSGAKLVKRADMTTQRQYVTATVVADQIYCLGGKGKFVMFKTIEKYLIAEDRWVEIRTQLNYARYFGSCCQFQGRFIYIFGGTSDTDQIEVLDLAVENEAIKCDLLTLAVPDAIAGHPSSPEEQFRLIFGGTTGGLDTSDVEFQPWFKPLIIPLEELVAYTGAPDMASYQVVQTAESVRSEQASVPLESDQPSSIIDTQSDGKAMIQKGAGMIIPPASQPNGAASVKAPHHKQPSGYAAKHSHTASQLVEPDEQKESVARSGSLSSDRPSSSGSRSSSEQASNTLKMRSDFQENESDQFLEEEEEASHSSSNSSNSGSDDETSQQNASESQGQNCSQSEFSVPASQNFQAEFSQYQGKFLICGKQPGQQQADPRISGAASTFVVDMSRLQAIPLSQGIAQLTQGGHSSTKQALAKLAQESFDYSFFHSDESHVRILGCSHVYKMAKLNFDWCEPTQQINLL